MAPAPMVRVLLVGVLGIVNEGRGAARKPQPGDPARGHRGEAGAESGLVVGEVAQAGPGLLDLPDYKPAVFYHVPSRGDAVPDFKLINQDGRAIHLGQFRGKDLLITFIYTRCPLPNFCPLVTHNFALIQKQLTASPSAYPKTHLLCVSFDPDHDTPERLRAYGATYIGSDAKSAFADWDFAVPEKPTLLEMAKFFNVGITNEADETITHTLSTTLIGADGKVVRFYPGNEWTPEQILADVKQTAGA